MRQHRIFLALVLTFMIATSTSAVSNANTLVSMDAQVSIERTDAPGGFSLSILQKGGYVAVGSQAPSKAAVAMKQQHIELLRLADGGVAIVDSSLLKSGAAIATTVNAVRLV